MPAPQANLHFNIISRGSGRSAVQAAAYRSGEPLRHEDKEVGPSQKAHDEDIHARSVVEAAAYRSGNVLTQDHDKRYDYTRKQNIFHTMILTPKGAPAWAQDRQSLWNAVEQNENRKNAQLAREAVLKLPRGLTHEQQITLVQSFVSDTWVKQGMVADIGFHDTPASDGGRNPHAHVMLTLRPLNEHGWNQHKNGAHLGIRGRPTKKFPEGRRIEVWSTTRFLKESRTTFERYVNEALEGAGITERVDLRSNKDKGLDQEPEPKLGPHVAAMERRGIRTDRGDEWRGVLRRNALIAYHETMRKQPWARDGDWINNQGWTGVEIATASSSSARQAAAERHEEVRRRLEKEHAEKMAQRNQQLLFQQSLLARKQREQQRQKQAMQQRTITRHRGR